MAIFASFVHCIPNILHIWPHDSFQVVRLSVTLGIFQGHWTVSHQISQKRCVIWQKLLYTTNRKSYISFRLMPLLMTLKYIWRSFQPRLHFHIHFSNPWHAFASHGLPAIAELLVEIIARKHTAITTLTFQGHVTSQIMWHFDSPDAICYWWSIGTEFLYPTVFEIFGSNKH